MTGRTRHRLIGFVFIAIVAGQVRAASWLFPEK